MQTYQQHSIHKPARRVTAWLAIVVAIVLGVGTFGASLAHSAGFTALASHLAKERFNHTATLLPSGKILVVGGDIGGPSYSVLASAELYDPATGTWTSTGALHTAREGHTATLLPSGQVLVVGGCGVAACSPPLSSAELYTPPNPDTGAPGTWTSAGSLMNARTTHTATLLNSGEVLVVGGINASGSLSSVELYNPTNGGGWFPATPMMQAREAHTATLLPSGQVLVMGGVGPTDANGDYDYVSTTELYDPNMHAWFIDGSLHTPRAYSTATLLPTGKILVVGGYSIYSASFFANPELYTPSAGAGSGSGMPVAGDAALTQRLFHNATLLPSGKVLVTGGYNLATTSAYINDAAIYDPATSTWSDAGAMSVTRASHTATLLPSGQVVLVGGFNSTGILNTAEFYDYSNGAWATTGSLNTTRVGHTATLLPSGQVLVAGGGGDDSAELYTPTIGTWAPTTGSPNIWRAGHTATLLPSGQVLVAGGGNFGGTFSSAELYDPTTGLWTYTGSLNTERVGHMAILLASGQVLVVGGDYDTSPTSIVSLNSTERYDPITRLWMVTGALNNEHDGGTATLLPSGQVLVAGGSGIIAGGEEETNSAELYNSATDEWTMTGSLIIGREYHTATLLPSGQVLVVGGYGEYYPRPTLSSAELYNPATRTWIPTGSLNTARANHTATLLLSGQVLVAGGATDGGDTALNSAELYNPASGTWEAAAGLATARSGHKATLLPSGQILVVGGTADTSGSMLSSAELYDPGLGFAPSSRPAISSSYFYTTLGYPFYLGGNDFTGDSEGSGGGTNASATNYPLVQLRRLDNEQISWVAPSEYTAGYYGSNPINGTLTSGVLPGNYAITMFVNGIPSQSCMASLWLTDSVTDPNFSAVCP